MTHPAPHPARRSSSLRACSLALSLGLWVGLASAQDLRPVEIPPSPPPTADPAPPAPLPTAALTAVAFSDEPLVLTQVGIKFQVPEGWSVQRLTRDATPAYIPDPELSRDQPVLTWTALATEESSVVELGPPDATLLVRIQTPAVEDERTPLDVLAQHLAQKVIDGAAANSGASPEAYAIFEKIPDLRIAGQPAYRFYMRVPRRAHETGLVMGYTLLDLPGPEFLVLEFISPEEHYVDAATRATYETVVAAMEFIDAGSIDDQRRQLMLAGGRFIAQQTEADYHAALARLDGRLERLYNPGGTGASSDDRERGVRRIHAWPGVRGEIDPSKPEADYNEIEREEGYLVSVAGRYFDTAEDPITGRMGLIVADFASTFWMSRDRQREAWLNRMQVRTEFHARPDMFTEIGARDADSLTIWTSTVGRPARTIRPVIDPAGYMTQVEFYLMPDLLARAGIPTDFGAYAWQTSAETCRFIRDEAIPESDGLGWTIRRSFGDTDEVHSIAYDGELRWQGTLREVGPALTRGEPTTADRINTLWTSKGLPTTDVGRSRDNRRPGATGPGAPRPGR